MKIFLSLLALALAGTLAGCKSSTPASGGAAPGASASASAKHHLVTLATFKGSGIENTPRFTVGGNGDWKLKWSYNCASFGQSGNFGVEENGLGSVAVNELGLKGHGETRGYDDAGKHWLMVDSECSWKMKVIGTR